MNIIKKLVPFFLALAVPFCMTACKSSKPAAAKKLNIVTTVFPEYDWVMNILGTKADDASVTMLLDSGVDLHSYQPTASDIMKIANCDLFIYIGGESDEWVEDALKEATNKDMVVLNLMEALGDAVREEELVEGMESDEDEGEAEEGIEYDEHIWLSLKNAQKLVSAISDALSRIDEDNAAIYKSNAEAYAKKLAALDKEYELAVSDGSNKTLLVADRFPFRYLAADYSLLYYAAFAGCSAETEASFKTVTFLAGKVDELSLSCIFKLEGSDGRIAETVVSNTAAKNAQILTLDSMQSTTLSDAKKGVSYLSIMEKNLEALKIALTK